MSGAFNKLPLDPIAITDITFGRPFAIKVVPSNGSTAMSTSILSLALFPTFSPIYNIGASSSSPSPITTSPLIFTDSKAFLIASTAAPSAPFLSPLPINFDDTKAAASVTLTSSSAKFLSIIFISSVSVINEIIYYIC